MPLGRFPDVSQDAQKGRVQHVEAPREARIAAVGRHQELEQVVRADRNEIDRLHQLLQLGEQGRHLQHGSQLHALGQQTAVALGMLNLAREVQPRRLDLRHAGDHRQHQPQRTARGRADERAELHPHQGRPVEGQAHGAPAESRVLLLRAAEIGKHLVATDIEQTERNGPLARRVHDRGVERLLRLGARELRCDHELQLGAEQAHALRPAIGQLLDVREQARIHVEAHLGAVARHAGRVAQGGVLLLPAGAEAHLLCVGRLELVLGTQVNEPLVAVHDDLVAVLGHGDEAARLSHDGQPHGARDDGDMARRGAFLQNEPPQPVGRIVQKLGRTHRAGHDDAVLRQVGRARGGVAPRQLEQEPVCEVVEVVQPLAQIGVVDVHHARTSIGLHLLHRALGGQPVAHGLGEAAVPARVMGEHAIGFQHRTVLAVGCHVAARKHVVDRKAQVAERLVEPAHLHAHVLREKVRHLHARIVQDDVTEPDPVRKSVALDRQRPVGVELDARTGKAAQLAVGDQLGEHHGDRFHALDLVGAELVLLLVLHRHDAQRASATQDGHAEEGVVDLLSRLGQVAEGGVRLGVLQRERMRRHRDRADQALAQSQLRDVDRLGVEAACGVKLQHPVGAQHVNRRHVGGHVRRDLGHDRIEPLLRAARLGHHCADPAQERARIGPGANEGGGAHAEGGPMIRKFRATT